MRTLRMAFVGGFAGASMAGNVETLQPLRRACAGQRTARDRMTSLIWRKAVSQGSR